MTEFTDRGFYDAWVQKSKDYLAAVLLFSDVPMTPTEEEQIAMDIGINAALTYVLQSAMEIGALEELRAYAAKLMEHDSV